MEFEKFGPLAQSKEAAESKEFNWKLTFVVGTICVVGIYLYLDSLEQKQQKWTFKN